MDTSTPGGRLQFHMCGAFDECLRELIVEGTLEGLASARRRGRVGGRPLALDSHGVEMARALYETKGDDGKRRYAVQQIANRLGVSRAAIYRHLDGGNPRPGVGVPAYCHGRGLRPRSGPRPTTH
ncbi:recombinase family protein [Nonomuraea sp. NPDC050478]|uniref:recombinase family protein n=1 Tax=Nonomuraea sp. NPDC050478 TaxID=3364365 RepID=UPI00378AF1E6